MLQAGWLQHRGGKIIHKIRGISKGRPVPLAPPVSSSANTRDSILGTDTANFLSYSDPGRRHEIPSLQSHEPGQQQEAGQRSKGSEWLAQLTD